MHIEALVIALFSDERVSCKLTKIVAVVLVPVADAANASLMIAMLFVYFLQI
jgi:hypothetical protein